MSEKNVRRCIAAGCLVTMASVSAGVALAQSPVEPGGEIALRTDTARDRRLPILTFEDFLRDPAATPLGPVSSSRTAPWLLETFVLFRAGPTFSVTPIDGATSTDVQAPAQLAPAKVPIPDTVQNLRRADKKP